MRIFISVLGALLTTSAVLAADIGKLNQKEPDQIISSTKNIFDIERCIIEVDALGVPAVYRQPDRPNKTQIAYSLGTGVPLLIALFQLEGSSKIEIRRGVIGIRKAGLPPKLADCF